MCTTERTIVVKNHMFNQMDKKIMPFLCSNFLLIWTYEVSMFKLNCAIGEILNLFDVVTNEI